MGLVCVFVFLLYSTLWFVCSVLLNSHSTLSQTVKFCNFFSSLIVGEMVGQNCDGCRSWEEDIYWSHFQFLHFVQFLHADYDQHLVSNYFLWQRNGIWGLIFEYMMSTFYFTPFHCFISSPLLFKSIFFFFLYFHLFTLRLSVSIILI